MKCIKCAHFWRFSCQHRSCFEQHFKYEVDAGGYYRVKDRKDKMINGYCRDYSARGK